MDEEAAEGRGEGLCAGEVAREGEEAGSEDFVVYSCLR